MFVSSVLWSGVSSCLDSVALNIWTNGFTNLWIEMFCDELLWECRRGWLKQRRFQRHFWHVVDTSSCPSVGQGVRASVSLAANSTLSPWNVHVWDRWERHSLVWRGRNIRNGWWTEVILYSANIYWIPAMGQALLWVLGTQTSAK